MQTRWRYVMWAAAVGAVIAAGAFAWTGEVSLAALALILIVQALAALYMTAGDAAPPQPDTSMDALRLRLATRRLRREARREQPRDEHEDYWQ